MSATFNDAATAGVHVPYATPAPRTGARAWAGAAILAGGLGLVLLGGCFLIGVFGVVSPSSFGGQNGGSPPMSGAAAGLMYVLYLCAFACFGGGAYLVLFGTRALLRVLGG